MRKRLKSFLGRLNFKYLLVGAMLLISVFLIYFWHLGSLTKGLSPAEASARSSSVSIHSITHDPVNAPQRLLQYAAQKAGYYHSFSMRLASVIFAILFIACIFWLMKAWFGLTIGVFSALVFATTPLVVLFARSATPNILSLTPSVLLAAYVWLAKHQHKPDKAWLLLCLVCGFSLYVPGMAWLIFGCAVWVHRRIIKLARVIKRKTLIASAGMLALLVAPLVWALVKNVSIYHQLLLLPAQWPGMLGIAKSIGWSALSLGWRTKQHNPLIIGRLPLLSVIQLGLLVFGAFVMWTRARREMTVLLASIVLAIVLSGINNNPLILGLCMPALAILAAAGLRYLYIEWRSIFPKNPLPLGFALLLIASLVSLQVVYGLRYSLVAWPHTAATKQLYVLK